MEEGRIQSEHVVKIPPVEGRPEEVTGEEEAGNFDTLTAKTQRTIVLLQERRSALIYAVVTGQIDGRGVAPPEPR